MDINRYGKPVRDLFAEYTRGAQQAEPGIMRILKRFLHAARETGDDALIGFVYYLMASESFFTVNDYDAFLKYTRQAGRYFVRGGDDADMKQIYYLISIDALNKGLYDISYRYNIMLGKIARALHQDTSAAISDEMTGVILLRIGMYREALRYTKSAREIIRKDPSHVYYFYNLTSCYINECHIYLRTGRFHKAEEVYLQAERFLAKNAAMIGDDIHFDHAMSGVCTAAELELKQELETRVKTMLVYAAKTTQITDLADDIRYTGTVLIRHGYLKETGRLLQILKQKNLQADAVHARRLLADMKVDYYAATGKQKALMEAFLEQDMVYTRLVEEQKNGYRFVRDLVQLVSDLQKERARMKTEKEHLTQKAQMDALCGIPNRRALNDRLEEAFEHAYQHKSRLTVCLIDIDGLKAYNDTHGHSAGDEQLKETGNVLSQFVREQDAFAARYGGDEFVLLFEGVDDKTVRNMMADVLKRLPLSASYGMFSAVPKDKNKNWDFLHRADLALYKNKRQNKGTRHENKQ